MTRLKTEWVDYMIDGMEEYNSALRQKIGTDLCGLAAAVFQLDRESLLHMGREQKTAVVPVTQGEGIIGSFSDAVAAIIRSMGFSAEVTSRRDVDGLYEGFQRDCSIFFLADDARYIGMNAAAGRVSDNNWATAAGFIQALDFLMEKHGKDMRRELILQIGYGIVGRESAKILSGKDIDFVLFDKDKDKLADAGCEIISRDEIRNFKYILDFTNEGGWLRREDLADDVLYVSPGVPYSMDEEAARYHESRAVHDNLEIGTAVMLAQCLI